MISEQGCRTAGADLVVAPHPITLEGRTVTLGAELRPGDSLAMFLTRAGVDLSRGDWAVSIGGLQVPRLMWQHTRPRDGQVVECRRRAGKQVLKIVAVFVLAYFTFGASLAFQVGMAAVNYASRPKAPKAPHYSHETGSTYSLQGGRNRARPYEPLGLVFGVVKVIPDYASQPYSWFEGEDQHQYVRLHAGVNCGSVDTLKVGETALSSFEGVVVSRSGFPGSSEQLTDWANVDTTAGGLLAAPTAPGSYTTRTSSAATVRLAVDLSLQLYDMAGDGSFNDAEVSVELERRLLPSGSWEPFTGSSSARTFASKTTKPQRYTITTDALPAGQYEVRLRKGTADLSTSTQANVVQWDALKSYQLDSGAYASYPQVGIRIKATGQLNGSLDEVSWIATAAATPVWTGSAWVTQATRNPGAQMLQFARGIYDGTGRLIAGMGLPDAQIDIEGLKAFMVHCAGAGHVFDHYFDAPMSCFEVLEAMASAGMGSPSWHSGRLGVVWMTQADPVECVVSMGNIKAGTFRVEYATREQAEEIEVTSLDRDQDWAPASLRVLAPGVTVPRDTARLAPLGVTNQAGRLRVARVEMARAIYQRKTVTWDMDLECLDFQRYSVVALSHDLTQWGYSGRLAAATDGSPVTLYLDQKVPATGASVRKVGVRVPGERGYRIFTVQAFTGETDTLTLAEAWPGGVAFPGVGAGNPAHDYLFIYDFQATPGRRLRVVSIDPTDDLSGARISAVPETDAFWTFVGSGAYTEPAAPAAGEALAVSNVVVTQSRAGINYDLTTELTVTFDVAGAFDHAQVWAGDVGQPLQLLGETRTRSFGPRWAAVGLTYTVQVIPFDQLGRRGTAASVNYTVTLGTPQGAGGNYTDFIFKRSATPPATPTGSTPAGWYDAPPAADGNPLWFSVGEKTSSGTLVGVWTGPVQIDGQSIQAQYSVDGSTGWHSTFTSGDLYARYRIGNDGTWSAAIRIVGEAGVAGAQVTLYQRTSSATAPSVATSGNTTYTFASGAVSGQPSGWSNVVPTSGGAYLWAIQQQAAGAGATATLANSGWSAPRLVAQDGAAGAAGLNSATVMLYQRTATNSAPALPNATVTYTFATGAVSGAPGNGWSSSMPSSGGSYLWATVALASATTATDTINAGEWGAASLVAQDGAAGAAGNTTALVYAYKRAASAPTDNPGDVTYTFASNSITTPASLANGWLKTIPSGSNPLYVVVATAAGNGATDTIAAAEWSSPVLLVQDGAAGGAGLNSATVELFQRTATSSAPASLPNASITYTFATGGISGTPGNGWSATIPSSGGGYLWVTRATASATTATDTIGSGEWAAASLVAQDGAAGAAGNTTALVYAYKRAASAPTDNPGDVTYTFASNSITTPASLANSWLKTIPSGSNPLYVVVATAAGNGATDTIAAAEWSSPVLLVQDGAAGAAGLNSATVELFQRTATDTAPALPNASITYTFATGAVSGAPGNGWSAAIPSSGGGFLWVTRATASSTGATDTINAAEWAAAALQSTDGTRTARLRMYRWALARPTTFPAGNSTYTWADATFTAPATLNDWSVEVPAAGAGFLWVVEQVYVDSGAAATSTVTWAATTCFVQGSAVEEAGVAVQSAVYVARVYLRQATKPATPTGGSFNFETQTLTAPSGGWSATEPSRTATNAPPDNRNTPTWVVGVRFVSDAPYATITAGAWSEPTIHHENDGAAATNNVYTLNLYARSATEPLPPTATTATYNLDTDTFSAGDLTTSPAWSRTRNGATATLNEYRVQVRITTSTPATDVNLTANAPLPAPVLVERRGADTRAPLVINAANFGITGVAWADGYANRAIRNAVTGETAATTLGATALNKLGDQVTITNGTTTTTKTWNGSAWGVNAVFYPGDVLSGGTISANVSLNTPGYVWAQGTTTLSVFDGVTYGSHKVAGAFTVSDPGPSSDRFTALFASTDDSNGFGACFNNTHASAGAGLVASGHLGAQFYTTTTTGWAVEAWGRFAATSGGAGKFEAYGPGTAAVQATASPNLSGTGLAIKANGKCDFSDTLSITNSGRAPLKLTKFTTASLPTPEANAVALHETHGVIFSEGTQWFKYHWNGSAIVLVPVV